MTLQSKLDVGMVQGLAMQSVVNEEVKGGTFAIVIEGDNVGEVDVCKASEETYVTVQLVDNFLTIDQMMTFLSSLKEQFGLPENQKISFQQI